MSTIVQLCVSMTERARLKEKWKVGRRREREGKQKEVTKREFGFKWWTELFYPLSMASWLPPLSQPHSPFSTAKTNDRCLAARVSGNLCLSPPKHRVATVIISSHTNQEPIHQATPNISSTFQHLHYSSGKASQAPVESWLLPANMWCSKRQNQKYLTGQHIEGLSWTSWWINSYRGLQYWRALTMQEWQEYYSITDSGRHTRYICPELL